jgi:hypothetical protein
MSKQTAVEWVIQYLNNVKPNEFCSIETIKELLQQAKAMEKEQMIDAFEDSRILSITNNCNSGEQYYNETFKQQEQ